MEFSSDFMKLEIDLFTIVAIYVSAIYDSIIFPHFFIESFILDDKVTL